MTISISRWFAVRLDFIGNVLILGIALFAAGLRQHVHPAKIGVVLSYTLGSTYLRCPKWKDSDHVEVTQSFCMLLAFALPYFIEQHHSGDDGAIR